MDFKTRNALIHDIRMELKAETVASTGLPKPPKGHGKLPKRMRPEEYEARMDVAKRTAAARGTSVEALSGSSALYGPKKGKFAAGARTLPSWNPRTGDYIRGPKKGKRSPRINLRTGKRFGGRPPAKPVKLSPTTGGWRN